MVMGRWVRALRERLTPTDAAPESGTADPGLSATLERILAAVERERRQSGLEFLLVIVLALTALGSTWCAYQSQLWNGIQLVRLADADIATQRANENRLAAQQLRTQDGIVVLHVMEAINRGDTTAVEAVRRRTPSPLREAIAASLALDPLNNPDAPGPLRMPQYVLAEDQRAKEMEEESLRLRAEAQRAGGNGDTYVLLTLLFASVLFFGGITGTFQSRRLRLGLGAIACMLFLVTTARLSIMPICG